MMELTAQNSRDLVELTGGKTGEGNFPPERASCCLLVYIAGLWSGGGHWC